MNKKQAALWLGAASITCLALGLLMTHHVIRTGEGTVILNKRFVTLHHSYVDARTWKSTDFKANPEVRQVMIRNGYADVISRAQRRELKQSLSRLKVEMGVKCAELKISVMRNMVKLVDVTTDYWFPTGKS